MTAHARRPSTVGPGLRGGRLDGSGPVRRRRVEECKRDDRVARPDDVSSARRVVPDRLGVEPVAPGSIARRRFDAGSRRTKPSLAVVAVALTAIAANEKDVAFEWLNRAYAQRDPGLTYLQCSPHFRSLHGDPRWRAFLKTMGFEE